MTVQNPQSFESFAARLSALGVSDATVVTKATSAAATWDTLNEHDRAVADTLLDAYNAGVRIAVPKSAFADVKSTTKAMKSAFHLILRGANGKSATVYVAPEKGAAASAPTA